MGQSARQAQVEDAADIVSSGLFDLITQNYAGSQPSANHIHYLFIIFKS